MPATAEHFVVPKPGVPCPTLPLKHVHPHPEQVRFFIVHPIVRNLPPFSVDASKPPAIKFQEIVRDDQAIIVERVKIPTPDGYAFIIRRLDAGAISVTTMFRAAFPTVNEEAEKADYLEKAFF